MELSTSTTDSIQSFLLHEWSAASSKLRMKIQLMQDDSTKNSVSPQHQGLAKLSVAYENSAPEYHIQVENARIKAKQELTTKLADELANQVELLKVKLQERDNDIIALKEQIQKSTNSNELSKREMEMITQSRTVEQKIFNNSIEEHRILEHSVNHMHSAQVQCQNDLNSLMHSSCKLALQKKVLEGKCHEHSSEISSLQSRELKLFSELNTLKSYVASRMADENQSKLFAAQNEISKRHSESANSSLKMQLVLRTTECEHWKRQFESATDQYNQLHHALEKQKATTQEIIESYEALMKKCDLGNSKGVMPMTVTDVEKKPENVRKRPALFDWNFTPAQSHSETTN